jgi:hypothetical protein
VIDELCKAIVGELRINRFVETGLFEGESLALVTRWFAELHPEFGTIDRLILTEARSPFPWNSTIAYPVFSKADPCGYRVHSVELDRARAERARALFASNPNVSVECTSSEAFLREFVPVHRSDDYRCFFYLDAHWNEYWPLRDEIAQILPLERFAICVDDFRVPGHPDFGYDRYGTHICGWGYVKDLFRGVDVTVYYPRRSNRDNRGWVLILKGFSPAELAFLDALPLFVGHPPRLRWSRFLRALPQRGRKRLRELRRAWRGRRELSRARRSGTPRGGSDAGRSPLASSS